ncbi:hypothetical protein [Microbacterium sp. 13-71-7]|jgi:hypothetical protein|uniref:hypothetical protein n=1 Tax=Microbacterium sp. 13-71-7 TaxID=1970399 RepID=UPI000BC7A0C4|nr:hypothetical protein [Microbacterium sp. 13-71-7]OZB84117.1 MAG: hypothetical protein B7X32_08170 [Microbacterium sp. 13-71-7]
MNARDGDRRAIRPDRGAESGEEADAAGADVSAPEPDAEDEQGAVAPDGSESGWPSDEDAPESVRPVVLGAAWRLPVVLLAMDGAEETGLDMRFDPETGEPLADG